MHYKVNARPKYGLSIKILSTFMGRKELKTLIDRYMMAKRLMILESFEVRR